MGIASEVFERLAGTVGPGGLITDRGTLESYAADAGSPVMIEPRVPAAAVRPGSFEQVVEVVRTLSDFKVPTVPRGCGLDYHGNAVPLVEDSVVVDLSGMTGVPDLKASAEGGMYAVVEPGVTFEMLQSVLDEKGMRIPMPARRPASATIISTYANNHPTFRSSWQGNYNFPMIIPTVQLVTAGGSVIESGGFHTGAMTISSTGMGLDRIPYGSLGTGGIITAAAVLFERKPRIRKIAFARFEELADACAASKRLLRYSSKEIGETHLILDGVCMSSLLSGSRAEFESAKKRLDGWTYVVCFSGDDEEWISIQEKHLGEVADELRFEFTGELGRFEAAPMLLKELQMPERVGEVHGYAPHNRLEFYTVFSRIPRYDGIIRAALRAHGFEKQPGVFVLPIEQARTCYVEYDIFFDPGDPGEVSRLRATLEELYPKLFAAGAFFARSDYPLINDLMREAAPGYYELVDEIKEILDPDNIFNAGRLFR
ncbi:MAG: FAD-binding oxidoreductase [Actinobacteria bacterium]|nr:FAD-binding oxidoreductase [Actinomycetota bacterium]MBU1944922.1 FAD-binding oxidoreductase [Actinomycetota bacterium]MBU2688152.1 FAD-binding oxidoreductase [Actinomycetota bacterium]